MKLCEIVYERTINGKIIKKAKIYGEELIEQEVPPKEAESVMEILRYGQKRAIASKTNPKPVIKKGKEYE